MTAKTITFVEEKVAQGEEWKNTEKTIMTRKKEKTVKDKRWQTRVMLKQKLHNNLL